MTGPSHHAQFWRHLALPASLRRYMGMPTEHFARAYEQWVYIRLPASHPLRAELQPIFDEKAQPRWFWDDADFAPIAAAMDALFKERGW